MKRIVIFRGHFQFMSVQTSDYLFMISIILLLFAFPRYKIIKDTSTLAATITAILCLIMAIPFSLLVKTLQIRGMVLLIGHAMTGIIFINEILIILFVP